LVSPEAAFLKGKFVWANWDVEELVERKEEILNTDLLDVGLKGVSFVGWSLNSLIEYAAKHSD
jgi:hypothetical protein